MSNALRDEMGEEAGEEDECHKSYVSRSEVPMTPFKKNAIFLHLTFLNDKNDKQKMKSDSAAPICPQL